MAAILAAAFLILLLAASAVPDITEILTSSGQYNTYLHYLRASYQISTLQSELSDNGITVFVPTDNAFQKLPAGFADNFSGLELSEFVLYHVLQNFHGDFATVQNPLSTMAGANFTFNISAAGEQVIVSTGVVKATASPFNVSYPLAAYSVDTVLQPLQLFGQSTGPSKSSEASQSSPALVPFSSTPPASASTTSVTPAPVLSSSTPPAPASTTSVTPAPGSSSPSTDTTTPASTATGGTPALQVGGAAAAGANLGMAAGVGLVGFLAMGLAL